MGKENINSDLFFKSAMRKIETGAEAELCLQRVNNWNNLPDSVVTLGTTNMFKNRLDKHWRDKKWETIKAGGLLLS